MEKGAHVILGPVAGPLGVVDMGGGNWEGFSPDPYLTGEMFQVVSWGLDELSLRVWLLVDVLDD